MEGLILGMRENPIAIFKQIQSDILYYMSSENRSL